MEAPTCDQLLLRAHSASSSFRRQSTELFNVLAEALEVVLVVWTFHETHLLGQEFSLVGPLGQDASPLLILPDWLVVKHGLREVRRSMLVHDLGLLWRQRYGLLALRDLLHGRRCGCLSLAATSPLLATAISGNWAARGRFRIFLVVVYTLHVVKQVVSPWKSIARNATFTSWIVTKVWPVTMSMHAMGLSLMA